MKPKVEPSLRDGYVKPEDIAAPTKHWSLIKVLYDGGMDQMALAFGKWDNEFVIGIRKNGITTDDKFVGNPQSRGLGTWFILDVLPRPALWAMLDALCPFRITPDDLKLVEHFIPRPQ